MMDQGCDLRGDGFSDISQESRAIRIDAPQVAPPAISHDAVTGIRDLDPLAVKRAVY